MSTLLLSSLYRCWRRCGAMCGGADKQWVEMVPVSSSSYENWEWHTHKERQHEQQQARCDAHLVACRRRCDVLFRVLTHPHRTSTRTSSTRTLRTLRTPRTNTHTHTHTHTRARTHQWLARTLATAQPQPVWVTSGAPWAHNRKLGLVWPSTRPATWSLRDRETWRFLVPMAPGPSPRASTNGRRPSPAAIDLTSAASWTKNSVFSSLAGAWFRGSFTRTSRQQPIVRKPWSAQPVLKTPASWCRASRGTGDLEGIIINALL
ncbi:hypothetical protein BGZ61DRAFT_158289 [Ilyonectria robusta]|uniref:uncharacterized protein n=1 Tax=Ilyonectria robusta TaxID=1079257 RepID=UPI001E8D27FC|nr:uncharacterized protein BGZ61DRAFT_158289 [Ilyonectria robusta]KAH8733371.1 hypothetical protein BGZ61DRAFT_158289 [Ilyonectria robusta]